MSVLLIGTRRVDLERGEVEGHGVLGRRELALLRYFVDHPDQVIGQDELLREVWGFSLRVRTRALYTAVYRLRMLLEEDPSDPRIIRSERGEGYLFAFPRTATPPERVVAPIGVWVGREPVVDQICSLWERSAVVTLTGAPGIGKSRLAMAVAQRRQLEGATVHVLRPGSNLLGAVGAVAGLGQGLRRGELVDAVVRELAARGPLLLVLDGAEEVDPGDAGDLVERLVDGTGVRLLSTSRSPLLVPGEEVVEVGPLDAADSVALLQRRVGSTAGLDDALARRIAARVEGIPLALELAGALVQTLGAAQAVELLEHSLGALSVVEAPTRPSFTAAVLRGWQLLTERERADLVAMAPFAGGFTLDHLRTVLGRDAIPAVARLRTRSFVHLRGPHRFGVYDPIREVVGRIAATDDLWATRRLHAELFVDLARAGSDAEVVAEQRNVEAAAETLVELGEPARACVVLRRLLGIRFSAEDHLRWAARGVRVAPDEETRAFFEAASAGALRRACRVWEALEVARAATRASAPVTRFLALHHQVEAAMFLGEYVEAEVAARSLQEVAPALDANQARIARLTLGRVLVHRDPGESLALVDAVQREAADEDEWAWGYAESTRGFALMRLDPQRAEEHLLWLEAWYRQRGRLERTHGLVSARLSLLVRAGRRDEAAAVLAQIGEDAEVRPYLVLIRGWIECLAGDLRRARPTLERCAATAEAAHEPFTESMALGALGQIARADGKWPEAEALLRRAAIRHAGYRQQFFAWLGAGLCAEEPLRAGEVLSPLDPDLLGVRCARWMRGEAAEAPALPDEHELVDRLGVELTRAERWSRAC